MFPCIGHVYRGLASLIYPYYRHSGNGPIYSIIAGLRFLQRAIILEILLANQLQSSGSTFSCVSFPSFFAFQEGMWDTQISALPSSPTVSLDFCRKVARGARTSGNRCGLAVRFILKVAEESAEEGWSYQMPLTRLPEAHIRHIEQIVTAYLEKNPSISNTELRALTGIKYDQATYFFNRMLEEGK